MYNHQPYSVYRSGGFFDHSFSYLAPHPAWYYYMPYHGAYWVHPPVYVNGAYAPGGFNWGNAILFVLVLGGLTVGGIYLVRHFVIPRMTSQTP